MARQHASGRGDAGDLVRAVSLLFLSRVVACGGVRIGPPICVFFSTSIFPCLPHSSSLSLSQSFHFAATHEDRWPSSSSFVVSPPLCTYVHRYELDPLLAPGKMTMDNSSDFDGGLKSAPSSVYTAASGTTSASTTSSSVQVRAWTLFFFSKRIRKKSRTYA